MFPPRQWPRVLNDSTHAVQVNCILLNKEQYVNYTSPIYPIGEIRSKFMYNSYPL
jgi:hypothetical protein